MKKNFIVWPVLATLALALLLAFSCTQINLVADPDEQVTPINTNVDIAAQLPGVWETHITDESGEELWLIIDGAQPRASFWRIGPTDDIYHWELHGRQLHFSRPDTAFIWQLYPQTDSLFLRGQVEGPVEGEMLKI